NDRIGNGFIGTGGRAQAHLDIVNSLKQQGKAAPVAVCDVYRPRLEAASKKTGGAKMYMEHEALLADPDVDVGVGQQRFVLHVHLGPAGLLAGGLESGTVDVADRNGRGLALLLETVDDVQVRLGSSPGADEAVANPIVGPPGLRAEDGEARHERRGPCRAQKVTPGRARAIFAGHLPWCLTHLRSPREEQEPGNLSAASRGRGYQRSVSSGGIL